MGSKILRVFCALLFLPFITFASHDSGKFVPVMKDFDGQSAVDMYAKKLNMVFTVLDCRTDRLLHRTAEDIALVWESISPVQITIQLDSSLCFGHLGDSINEIYWDQSAPGEESIAGAYEFLYNDETRAITEEDIAINLNLVGIKAIEHRTTTSIVLYNALMHHMGNAMGLASIHETYPDDCSWSVMLSTCHGSRLPPQDADIAAIEHIYFERHEDPELGDLGTFERVSDFDTNENNKIDTSEFEIAMTLWTLGDLDDRLFLAVFELWMSQNEIIPTPQPAQIRRAAVRIFDLQGELIEQSSCTNSPMNLMQRTLRRSDRPFGVYLMQLQDCFTGQIEVKIIAKTP